MELPCKKLAISLSFNFAETLAGYEVIQSDKHFMDKGMTHLRFSKAGVTTFEQ